MTAIARDDAGSFAPTVRGVVPPRETPVGRIYDAGSFATMTDAVRSVRERGVRGVVPPRETPVGRIYDAGSFATMTDATRSVRERGVRGVVPPRETR